MQLRIRIFEIVGREIGYEIRGVWVHSNGTPFLPTTQTALTYIADQR
jgi:hypothetical protein